MEKRGVEMPLYSIPSLRKHVRWQRSKSLVYLLSATILFLALPKIIFELLVGKFPTIADQVSTIFIWYPIVLVAGMWVIFRAICAEERTLLQYESAHFGSLPKTRATFLRLLSRLETKHDVRLIISDALRHENIVALAVLGRHGQRYVWVNPRIESMLDDRQIEAVLAHELAHLRGTDMFERLWLGAGLVAINLGFGTCGLLIVLSALMNISTSAAGQGYILASVIFCVAYGISWLLFLAHSRTAEYLADVGMLELAGPDFRTDLISGLITFHTGKREAELIIQKYPTFFHTHPALLFRARALKVRLERLDGKTIAVPDAL